MTNSSQALKKHLGNHVKEEILRIKKKNQSLLRGGKHI
jgi:hypothetical protein